MLVNLRLDVEYEGTGYFGWQVQRTSRRKAADKKRNDKLPTVQGEVERAVEKLFNCRVKLICAGRTDRGVHACQQIVNFSLDTDIPLRKIKAGLNCFLPSDIRINLVKRVPAGFHSRFWAKSKIYRYIILNSRRPKVFWNNYAWFFPRVLDMDKIKRVGTMLQGRRDCSIFAKNPGKYKDCYRNIHGISVVNAFPLIKIYIHADGFLHNMARNIVRFMTEAGEDKISIPSAREILRNRMTWRKNPAPCQGLYLYRVKYE